MGVKHCPAERTSIEGPAGFPIFPTFCASHLPALLLTKVILHRQRALTLHVGRHVLDLLPHTQQIAAHDAAGLVISHASAQQLSHQIREFAHVLQSARRARNAIKVAADADVFEADLAADVHDVVGDLGEGVVLGIECRQLGRRVGRRGARDELWHEGHHDYRVCSRHEGQDVVGHVTWVGTESVGGGMREDDGREAAREGLGRVAGEDVVHGRWVRV